MERQVDDLKWLECRRYAPKPEGMACNNGRPKWPEVKGPDWCGEWNLRRKDADPLQQKQQNDDG